MPSSRKRQTRIANLARQFHSYLESKNIKKTLTEKKVEQFYEKFKVAEGIECQVKYKKLVDYLIYGPRTHWVYRRGNSIVFANIYKKKQKSPSLKSKRAPSASSESISSRAFSDQTENQADDVIEIPQPEDLAFLEGIKKTYCCVCKTDFGTEGALEGHRITIEHKRKEKLAIIKKGVGKKAAAGKFSMAVTSKLEGAAQGTLQVPQETAYGRGTDEGVGASPSNEDGSVNVSPSNEDGSVNASPSNEDGSGVTDVVCRLGESKKVVFTVANKDDKEDRVCTLVDVTILWSNAFFDDSELRKVNRVTFAPGASASYTVECKARQELGYSYVPIVFTFEVNEPDKDGQAILTEFHIVRYLRLHVVGDLFDELKANGEYKKPDKRVPFRGTIVPGLKLPSPKNAGLQLQKVDNYYIPLDIRKELSTGAFSAEIKSLLLNGLSWLNYGKKLSFHLHAEELQMEKDIREFDMKSVTFTEQRNFLFLEVPGLAENRPSLLRGDRLFACEHREQARRFEEIVQYEGIVHQVQQLNVKLGFNARMPFIRNKKFDVQFTFNRLPLRMMHRAVKQTSERTDVGHLLFPETDVIGQLANNVTIESFYDPKLNEEQKIAVKNIVRGTSRPAPYIVFGPPGTGKTVTIVEAIKQVCALLDGSVILACAPENNAADLIAERLLAHVDKRNIFRMYASSRTWSCVPDKLKEARVVNFDSVSHEVYFPSKEQLMNNYRIIITTLVTAGRLVSAEFGLGHFTHIFIDEAGHAVEPEALIPIAGLLECRHSTFHAESMKSHGQLVLAGDPKQLGPVVRSKFARVTDGEDKDSREDDKEQQNVAVSGLDMSLLERLMGLREVYGKQISIAEESYNTEVITKLVNNYRSHKDIIEIPNAQFYEREMKECAGEFRKVMLGWEELPNKEFPIIFHPVFGADEREASSPSFFNVAEVETVEKYLSKLLDDKVRSKRMKIIKPHMIGIIAPYRKQVHKIQKMIEKRRFGDIKVGSVEEFQGQERCIIIISSVRSPNQEYINLDKKHGMGFVCNPKRFNVAITRAQALIILIGNPELLTMDDNWKEFVQFCYDNDADVGHTPRDKLSDITKLVKDLHLAPPDVAIDPVDEDDPHENPEWTRHE